MLGAIGSLRATRATPQPPRRVGGAARRCARRAAASMERPDASAAREASPEVNSARASPAYYKEALTLTLKRLGWRNVTTGRPSVGCVVWCDEPVRRPDFLSLPVTARINRFYAMVRVCRKVCLAQLLDVCTRLHPEHFGTFTPQTWWVGKSWPAQLKRLRAFCEREGAADTPFIVKPDSGCQGAGITLVRGHEELAAFLRSAEAPERAVVQVCCALRSKA